MDRTAQAAQEASWNRSDARQTLHGLSRWIFLALQRQIESTPRHCVSLVATDGGEPARTTGRGSLPLQPLDSPRLHLRQAHGSLSAPRGAHGVRR